MCVDDTKVDTALDPELARLQAALKATERERDTLKAELRHVTAELEESQAAVAKLGPELAEKSSALVSQRAILGDAGGAASQIDELLAELRAKERHIERDTATAKAVAKQLLPLILPTSDGVNITVRYDPTEKVGADLYDVIDMSHRCLGFLVADASGSGLQAALLAAMTKMAFKTFTASEMSPRTIVERVNKDLCEHTLDGQFLTAFFGVLDCETLRLKYVNASHCAPVLVRRADFELLDTEGLFLGMFEDGQYEEKEVQLCEDDKLVFYTDGITQAIGDEGKLYRNKRLYEFLTANSDKTIDEIADQLYEDLKRHRGGQSLADDATLLGIEVTSRPSKETRMRIPSDPAEIHHIDTMITSSLESRGYGERTLFGIKLALEEALINAIKHGNRNDKAKDVTVTFSIDDEKASIRIADEGEGFKLDEVPDPTLDENLEVDHGRGIFLMRAYMDDVFYSDDGTEVTMVKNAPWVVESEGEESP